MITLTWFNGANYISKSLKIGDRLAVSGKVEFYNGLQIIHPEYDKLNEDEDPLNSGIISPLYTIPASLKANKIDNLSLKKTIKTLISEIGTIPDYFSSSFRKKYNLILIDEALRQIHFPNSSNALNNAIYRLKFGEHFFFSINDVIKKIIFEQASIKGTE